MKKPNKRSTNNKDKWRKHSVCILLPPNWINHKAELQSIEEDYANQTNSDTNSNASDKTSLLPEQVME